MLCCGCLFVELIDRREGVLWKQKRNTREGQGGGGSRGRIEGGFLEGVWSVSLVD